MECGWRSLSVAIFLFCISQTSSQQRVAPGVPPQHYQGGQPQMHQVPVQHAQQPPPVQHHQVPVQVQHQQQQFAQQPPPVQQQQQQHQQGGHQMHHGHHGGPPQVLNVANIAQEKEHIAEHLSVPIDTSKMSEQELQFHYFKMHDSDNNNKLDGCELIKSLIHWHEQGQHQVDPSTGQQAAQEKIFKDEELVNLIDPILSVDDTNADGFIDYPEFVRAQQKAASGPPPPRRR